MSKTYKELKEEVDTLDNAAQQSLKELEYLDIPDETDMLSEEQQAQLQEAGVSAILIISTIMALPSLFQKIVKAFSFVWNKIRGLFSDEEPEESKAVEKILEFTEKWHHAYIKTLEQLLKFSGVFKSAKITDPEAREKATKVVFYTIIFGLAVYGGFASAAAIKKVVANAKLEYLDMAAFETMLTVIKSQEIKDFVSELMG